MSEPEQHRSLEALDRKLAEAEAKRVEKEGPEKGRSTQSSRGMALGFRISIEIVACIAVGTIIGLALDRTFETGPLFMIAFLFLGAGAGVMNAIRAAKGADSTIGRTRELDEEQRRQNAERDQE